MSTRVRYDLDTNWAGGVVTNSRPDNLAPHTYFSAQNCQLRNIGGGTAILGTRPGMQLVNSTKIYAGTVLGQVEYRRYSGSTFTGKHIVVTANGAVKVLAASGLTVNADVSQATPLSAGEYYPQFATAVNLLFIANGVNTKKYNGTAIQAVGGAAPAAPTVTDSGVGGTPNGVYDFAVTYYNSATGYETSRSGYNSVTVASKKITVSWVAPTDTQFDFVRVHIRKGSLSGSFFRLITGVTPSVDTDTGGYAVATTSTLVDISDTLINALLIVSPSTSENDPPPVLDRLCFHQSRLFGIDPTDPSTLLFSKLSTESVEAFNPAFNIPVNVNDGDRITALVSCNELELLVFKSNAVYALRGTYPDWQIENISNSVGCTSATSTMQHNKLTYFWSQFGPAQTDGTDVKLLAQPDLADTVSEDALQFNLLDKVVVGFDAPNQRVIWAIPGLGKNRNDRMLPYAIQLGVFESELWQLLDCASAANVLDANGVPRLHFGDYKGRVFRFDHITFNDGVGSGTKTGTGITTSYTATTINDTGALFYATGDGLAQLYVIMKNEEGEITQRKRIGSNTGTHITLDSGETFDPVPNGNWTYHVGAIDMIYNFGWKDGSGTPFWKKQLEYLTLDIVPPQGTVDLDIHVYTTIGAFSDIHLDTHVIGSAWDTALWDSAIWGGTLQIEHVRQRIGVCARTYLVDVRVCAADAPLAFVRAAVRSKLLTEKA